MWFLILFNVLWLSFGNAFAQFTKPVVYLIPGQGADSRLFKNINIDSCFETKSIHYFTPEKGSNMTDYAKALSQQIDTSRTYYLVGVSLGGMLVTEMGDFLNPEKMIIISSAKHRNEFPGRYRFQKAIPIYKLFPAGIIKVGARLLQPIVEPARNNDKETFNHMLNDKDPAFLKRTISMIMEWNRISCRPDIIHIHGDRDHTIPIKNVSYNLLIKDGSHMMVLTRGEEMSDLLNQTLIQP